ncbi:MFS transporter [Lactobacillus sp. Sy-1]|uniref:MFS transporter n=1 Tax=Lactobacillus sp. Sy-1 TaxID=2109645 RepID=UPI001C59A821|nr:MFS transporter [Lactobacillus sp. Sy-1]MBW1604850.1 MFS transporter [Lactobacillus sp. Sy-1]
MSKDASNWNAKTLIHRFAILSISLIITTGTAISPALPAMEKTFSNYPSSLVDMVATIQQIPAFIVLLFSSSIAKKFGMKNMIGLGLLLMGISGVLPAIFPNLWIILGLRIIFGIGIGLFNSLAITIIDNFYDGHDQSQMLGVRSSFEQIGICITNILVGALLSIGWQASFLSYSMAFIVLVIFWLIVPKVDNHTDEGIDDERKEKPKATVNSRVIGAGFMCSLMTIGMAIVSVLVPSIIVSLKIGTAQDGSFVITLFTLVSMTMGFLFGKFVSILGKFVYPLGLLCLSVGTILLNYAHSIPMIIVSIAIIGCTFPLAGNYLFSLMDVIAPKNSTALANSVLLVGSNMGTAFSPIVVKLLNGVSPMGGAQPGIGLFGVIIALMVLSAALVQIFNHKKPKIEVDERNRNRY